MRAATVRSKSRLGDERVRKSPNTVTLVALIALGLVYRGVRYGLGFPIWGDEAFVAVNFVTRDYAGMIRPLDYGQIVPLLFMWAQLAITQALGLSEWALRLVAFLAGVAALWLFVKFALDVLPRRAALLAVAIFAASYYVVRHSAEVKPYETDLLVSLLLLISAWRVHRAPASAAGWVVLMAVGVIAPWASYPANFVIATVAVFLLFRVAASRRPVVVSARISAWLFSMLAALSAVAMYLLYAKPHAEAASRLAEIKMWTATFPPLAHPLKLLVWFFGIHTGNMLAYPHGAQNGGSAATFVLVILGSIRLWKTNRPLLWLLLGPLVFTFAAAALHKYPYGGSARTSLYMAPAICLLAGLGAWQALAIASRCIGKRTEARRSKAPAAQRSDADTSSFAERYRRFSGTRLRVGVFGLCGLMAALILGFTAEDIREPYKSRAVWNSREAVRTLARQAQPGDRWIIFNSPRPVDYAPYLGDWRGVGGQFVFDALRYAPVSIEWAPVPGEVRPTTGRTWLLAYQGYKVEFPQEQFQRYREALTTALGEPTAVTRFDIKSRGDEIEALHALLFAEGLRDISTASRAAAALR